MEQNLAWQKGNKQLGGALKLTIASSPERTRELLGVLNYLAAPFGSQEQMLLSYDVQSDFLSAVIGIVSGHRPVGALAQAVSNWRTKGGDTLRAEYEALAANKSQVMERTSVC